MTLKGQYKSCSVIECGTRVHARDMCEKHYRREMRRIHKITELGKLYKVPESSIRYILGTDY